MSRVPRTCVPQVMGPSGVMVGVDTFYLGLRSSARFGLSCDSSVPSVWAAGGYACRRGRGGYRHVIIYDEWVQFVRVRCGRSSAVDPVRSIQCGLSKMVCLAPVGWFFERLRKKIRKYIQGGLRKFVSARIHSCCSGGAHLSPFHS